jgi:hypothetical protein
VGGYKRGVSNRVLEDLHGVAATCGFRDSDCEVWEYVRVTPEGTKETAVQTFDVGLAAYPPDTLLHICRELIESEWDAIRAEIVKRGGWTGRPR